MSDLHERLEEGLRARRACDELLLIADETSSVRLRWAGNTLTTNGVVTARRFTAVALRDGRAGVVGHGGEGPIAELVRAAEHAAAAGLSTADTRTLPSPSASADWARPAEQVPAAVLDSVLPVLGEAFEQAVRAGRRLDGYAEQRVVTTHLAASTGLRLRHAQPTGVLDLSLRSGDDASIWSGHTTADLATLDVRDAVDRLTTRLPRTRARTGPPPGPYEVLLSPACTADLMLHLYQAAGARAALDGHGPFGTRKPGERLTDMPLTLRSDPGDPRLPCAPFLISRGGDDLTSVADNGLPLAPTRWIDDGVLAALVQTRHTAELTGRPVTALVDNLILEGPPGAPALAEMVRSTRRGLLITSLWYLRDVDPGSLLLTGTTRDGVLAIEDGEIAGAVPDFRFNESPLSLLARVTEIGRSEPALPREWGDYFTRMVMPPLRVPGFSPGPPV